MLIEHPEIFKMGTRVIMRTMRNKDGNSHPDEHHPKKVVTHGHFEFETAMKLLVETSRPGERIYSTCESRSIPKAIREFKRRQLENDYSKEPENFYVDMRNRWVSCLQTPSSRSQTLFLFDCDSIEEFKDVYKLLASVLGLEGIMDVYPTKNGGHVITRPFEYPKMIDEKYHHLIQKNAMMLWMY